MHCARAYEQEKKGQWSCSKESSTCSLILTVTAPEQQAAIKVIQKAAGKAMEQKDCLNTITKKFAITIHYVEWDGFFESKERGPAKIALVCATEMGRESSAQGVVLISQTTLKPSVIVMVGMCAGYEKRINLGDVMVPFRITRASGKEYADGKFVPSAIYAKIDSNLQGIVASEANSSKCEWVRFIPDDMRSTPSPVYLHDFILSKIPPPGKATTFGTVFDEMKKEKPEWTNEIISIGTLEEMVSKIMLKTEKFATSKDDFFGRDMSLERTRDGEEYVNKKSKGGLSKFPEDPSNPVISTAEVYSGDIVDENIDFKRLAEETGQRNLAGYEMEGYSFLNSAEKNMNCAHRLFAKGVSDLGTAQSKMDYYQPYCAASAMAVVCHMFKGRDFFFSSAKAPVPAPPEKPGSGDTTQHKQHDGLPSDETEVDDDVALAVSQVADKFWEGIANTLKVKTLNINYRTADVNLYQVIDNWRLAAKTTPTVGELLKACKLNGVERLAIAEKYKQIKSIMSS